MQPFLRTWLNVQLHKWYFIGTYNKPAAFFSNYYGSCPLLLFFIIVCVI
jgi:hypothetical protein